MVTWKIIKPNEIPEKVEHENELDDPKPVFGNTVLIRASVLPSEQHEHSLEQSPEAKVTVDEKPKIETQKEVAELRNYFNAFIKEPEKTPEEPKVEEKTKGSILKRLKEKFSPKMSKKVCGVGIETLTQTTKTAFCTDCVLK